MYFYGYKITKNENEQNTLLEMCSNACIRYGNGRCGYGMNTHKYLI